MQPFGLQHLVLFNKAGNKPFIQFLSNCVGYYKKRYSKLECLASSRRRKTGSGSCHHHREPWVTWQKRRIPQNQSGAGSLLRPHFLSANVGNSLLLNRPLPRNDQLPGAFLMNNMRSKFKQGKRDRQELTILGTLVRVCSFMRYLWSRLF